MEGFLTQIQELDAQREALIAKALQELKLKRAELVASIEDIDRQMQTLAKKAPPFRATDGVQSQKGERIRRSRAVLEPLAFEIVRHIREAGGTIRAMKLLPKLSSKPPADLPAFVQKYTAQQIVKTGRKRATVYAIASRGL